DHELDAWLNPTFFHAQDRGPAVAPAELARRLEASDPRLYVSYLPLAVEPGAAVDLFVTSRIPGVELPFNEVSLDPSSGRVLGRRQWGEASLSRLNLLPFLYRFHYTLHLTDASGVGFGALLMGVVALLWMLDAFFALYISFPSWKVWRRSFAFRFGQGTHKLTFDLHRSSGVWLWPVLLVFALTAVSMNLGTELVRPVVQLFSPLTPMPWQAPAIEPHEPRITRERAIELAASLASEHGIDAPVGSLYYSPLQGYYALNFHRAGDAHGDGGLGNPQLFIDADTGAPIARTLPNEGSAGDLFMRAQFPLHSGRIFGLLGRATVSVLGVVIAMLSFTGVWLWAKKRIAHARRLAPRSSRIGKGTSRGNALARHLFEQRLCVQVAERSFDGGPTSGGENRARDRGGRPDRGSGDQAPGPSR
ncbi:MAG TPA: PepSY-associated TM helix domain-containing protein, partial [Polyangiales bacterium]